MRSFAFHILLLMTALGLSSISSGAPENPNVNSSFRANTTVPSEGQRRRLVTQPNPVSTTGNDVITGNVGGLGYFRGVVPYGSTYYTGANVTDTGTTAVSSFLRRSVNPIVSDRNPGQSRVFYEPRRAVSSFQVQNAQRSALSESIATGRSRKSTYLTDQTEVTVTDSQQRPLTSDARQLDQILARQFELKEKARESNRRLLQEQEKDSEFQNFFEITLDPEQAEKPVLEKDRPEEPLEDTRREPVTREIERPLDEVEIEPDRIPESVQDMELPEELPIRRDGEQPQPVDTDEQDPSDTNTEGIDLEKVRQRAAEHAEAERIRGEHPTIESLARSRFGDYMQAGEAFMQEGRYYKAADTYHLAALWRPDDPRPYMAQSFALFAAGEYMSSAYYLSRAIAMDPAMAAKKYDLPGLVGDRDVFENRLIEMTTWQQRSESGELAFLMAYVLFHDGKPADAKAALEEAETQMPDNPAVTALKRVILPDSRTSP